MSGICSRADAELPQKQCPRLLRAAVGCVTTGRGVTYDIPKGWTQRMADNGKGLVFQRSGRPATPT
jgi:hypothetical protein